ERGGAKQALSQSEERFRLIVEAAPSPMVAVDQDGIINLVNAKAQELFGYHKEELLGRPVEMLVPDRFRGGHANYRQNFLTQPISRPMGAGRDLFGLHKTGHEIPIEIGLTPYESSEGLFTLALIVDITERKRAEEQNRFLANLVASVSDAIIAVDLQQNIQSWNNGAETMYGWKEDEVLGRPAKEILDTDFLDITREAVTKQIMEQGYWAGEVSQLHRDGTRIPALSSVALYKDSQGKPAGIVAVNRDITDRKQTEEEIRKLNTELEQRVAERTAALSQANALLHMLLDHMPDHIYFKDAQSRFIRNSRSQAKALGLSDPAEAVGKSDFDFFPHAQQSFEKEQEIIRSGTPLVDDEEWVVWPDGQATWVSTTKVPLRDPAGKVIGTFGISRDITDRKKAEIALQRAKLELEAANKELEAFSYSVSHDLRAPLRSVDGFSQALLEDYGEILPAEGRNFLERIRKSAQRMADLIDDLLNLSRVTRAPLKSLTVDLSKLAENIAAELKQNNSERDVRFIIAQNLRVQGDPHLLQIVLENLMGNAWKFTSKRELAEIEVGTKSENGEIIYFVRDNGAGFDMTYANKLFGAFQRLHAMTEFPGTGIGLATIQRIIHRHGGRVWAEGTVDQGATFFFTLPVLVGVQSTIPSKEKEDSIHRRAKEII
ncbi:MAG TPA: PAS domain S-box protein, partial [Anaerolineales bacterium]|nr:PAS domain S-box protein [Anaerolineales bacterium]